MNNRPPTKPHKSNDIHTTFPFSLKMNNRPPTQKMQGSPIREQQRHTYDIPFSLRMNNRPPTQKMKIDKIN